MGRPLGNFHREELPKERLKLDYQGYGVFNHKPVIVGNYQWQPLLDEIDSFSYRSITLRKEIRRGCEFWYAFRKVNGKTKKIYCGKKYEFYGLAYFERLYQRFEELTTK